MENKKKLPENKWLERLHKVAMTLKAVIVNNENKVLILKRSKDEITFDGLWDLPGGGLEGNESLEQAIKREIIEETGLEVEVGPIIKYSEYPAGHNFFDKIKSLRFIAFHKSGEVKLNKDEHDSFEWLEVDEAIGKLSEKGFEGEKRATLIAAKSYLQMKEGENRWKRCLADLENYKKRTEKANEEFRRYCLEDFISELLPVLDHFEIATEHIPYEKKEEGWITGIMHIKGQLGTVLNNKGIKEIKTNPGDEIDANIHEVISGEGDKVKKVLKKGYRMGDRVIRAVVVEAGE